MDSEAPKCRLGALLDRALGSHENTATVSASPRLGPSGEELGAATSPYLGRFSRFIILSPLDRFCLSWSRRRRRRHRHTTAASYAGGSHLGARDLIEADGLEPPGIWWLCSIPSAMQATASSRLGHAGIVVNLPDSWQLASTFCGNQSQREQMELRGLVPAHGHGSDHSLGL